MNVLLDSHCLLWWLADMEMSDAARDIISDPSNSVFVSAASIWELEIKASLGKLVVDADLISEVPDAGFSWLPITAQHGRAAAQLPKHHRDPLDRMLIAQAQVEQCTLISRNGKFDAYAVALIKA